MLTSRKVWFHILEAQHYARSETEMPKRDWGVWGEHFYDSFGFAELIGYVFGSFAKFGLCCPLLCFLRNTGRRSLKRGRQDAKTLEPSQVLISGPTGHTHDPLLWVGPASPWLGLGGGGQGQAVQGEMDHG